MIRIFRRLASLLLVAWITPFTTSWAADTALHTWRIEVDGGANNHGEIVFSFVEDDVEIARISVAIPKGTPENNVARRIRREFRRVLSKDDYGVDLDGGENVLISPRSHGKRFEFRLVRNSVGGTVISTALEETRP